MNVMTSALEQIDHIIGGESIPSAASMPVFNPATGEQIASVAAGGVAEVDRAVTVAKQAQRDWGATPPAHRAAVMFKMRQLMIWRREQIAHAISREHGKTAKDALGEVARALEVVEFASAIPHHLKGAFSRDVTAISTEI